MSKFVDIQKELEAGEYHVLVAISTIKDDEIINETFCLSDGDTISSVIEEFNNDRHISPRFIKIIPFDKPLRRDTYHVIATVDSIINGKVEHLIYNLLEGDTINELLTLFNTVKDKQEGISSLRKAELDRREIVANHDDIEKVNEIIFGKR